MPEPIQSLISKDRSSASLRFAYQSTVLFFNVALALFIAALVVLGGLFFYNGSLNSSRQSWVDEVKKEEDEFNKRGGAGNLVDLSNALNVTGELVNNHVFSSNIFFFLQETTHPRVRFVNFSFSREGQKIDLSGEGISYRTVSEQISIFESNSQVEKVDFGGLSLGEKGLVNFKVAIFFKPSLLELRLAKTQAGSASTGD